MTAPVTARPWSTAWWLISRLSFAGNPKPTPASTANPTQAV